MKRTLAVLISVFLVCASLSIPVCADTTTYDADIFGGNAEYLLEEHFGEVFTTKCENENVSRPSGWDIDYRGGLVKMRSGGLLIDDSVQTDEISLKHELISVKSGAITFETSFTVDDISRSNLIYTLGNKNNYAMKLKFSNGRVYQVTGNSEKNIANYAGGKKTYVKAEISLDTRKIKMFINNKAVDYCDVMSDCDVINQVAVNTGKSEICTAKLHCVNVYRNFIVREKFMMASEGSIPQGFEISSGSSGSGIAYAPGSPYADDRNGFALKNSSSVPETVFSKSFDNSNAVTTVSWTMYMSEKQDGLSVNFKNGQNTLFSAYTENGNIYVGNSIVRQNYLKNLWYTISLDIDDTQDKIYVSLNGNKLAQTVSYDGGMVNSLEFVKSSESYGEVIIDDIEVKKAFEKYADYPSEPVAAPSDDANCGMIMYPMWREGMHYGWDTISPYEDERRPLMGYYTEGQREVSDWQNKWLIEHGVDYEVYPFVRPNSYSGEAIKKPIRGEDLNDGYMNSYYSSGIKFAILLSGFGTNAAGQSYPDPDNEKKYHGVEEFKKNVIPYISEYYFQNPNYMKINNRLPVFCFALTSMNSTFGGTENTKRVINALDDEAKRLGYDGIIFGADAVTANGHSVVESMGLDNVRIWTYGYNSGDVEYLKKRTDEEYEYSSKYIASISTGYDDTPWRESKSDTMSADDVKALCEHVKNNPVFASSSDKMVMFTCWNEYGEGHYFAPSSKCGFGYLNAIRSTFTSHGEKTDEQIPSEQSVARMEAFYPNGRGALKTLADKMWTDSDMLNRKRIARMDFNSEKEIKWNYLGNCTAAFKNGSVEVKATGTGGSIYFPVNDSIDISDVTALKIRAYTKGGHRLRVYYLTENNTIEGQGKFFETDKVSGNDQYDEYVLYPNVITPDSGNPIPTGKITRLRISPDDDLYQKGANYGIDYIEFYGDYTDTDTLYRYEFDDRSLKTLSAVNSTAKFEGWKLECEANDNDPQLYITLNTGVDISDITAMKVKAYTTGTNDFKIYYITENNTAYGGGKTFSTNSVSGDGEYAEYILNKDTPAAATTGKITAIRIDPADDIYLKGAKFGIDYIEFLGQKTNQKLYVDGTKAKFTVRPILRNGTVYLPIYSVLLNEMRAFASWDKPTETLTVSKNNSNLVLTAGSNSVTVNHVQKTWENAPYFEKGNVFVPAEEFFDSLGYDVDFNENTNTIRANSRQTFGLKVLSTVYGSNILRNYNESTASTDYGTSNAAYTVENIDSREAVKIVPNTGGTDGLFMVRWINYNGKYTRLDDAIAQGGKMLVSFYCKGDCGNVYVENRSGGHVDQKVQVIGKNNEQWTRFSYVFDNKGLAISDSDRRWLAIRVQSSSGTNPYLYISDFKVRCLEQMETDVFDESLDVTIMKPTGEANGIPYRCIVGEYSKDNVLLNATELKSGNTSDEGDNEETFTYDSVNGDVIKIFLWSDVTPLCAAREFVRSSDAK